MRLDGYIPFHCAPERSTAYCPCGQPWNLCARGADGPRRAGRTCTVMVPRAVKAPPAPRRRVHSARSESQEPFYWALQSGHMSS